MIDIIKKSDAILSVIIRENYRSEGIEFFTPLDFSQQLGYMNRKKGYAIPPHRPQSCRKESYTDPGSPLH